MSSIIIPLDDFLKLDTEEQVELLKKWKMDFKLKDIQEAWGFKHSAQYYMLLKKLRIYERVVNKSNKFFPDQLLPSRSGGDALSSFASSAGAGLKRREDHFDYELNLTLTGPELADKLERAAHFVRGENKRMLVKLSIQSVEAAVHKQAIVEEAAATSE